MQDRVNVSSKAYADFLRGVGAALPGLEVTVAVSTGYPFMVNFSLLLSSGPTGGNAISLLDMALYYGANATQWTAQLDAALANAGGGAASRPGALGAGLSLRPGSSSWEGTPAAVTDRFRVLESRGVRDVGVFEFTHGGLPVEVTSTMKAAWTAALQAFVQEAGTK